MDKNQMPSEISYTLLVHGGSLKSCLNKLNNDLPNLTVRGIKKRAIHYYVILVTENKDSNYKKDEIYKLPIMAMREEFSNYLFFKSVKTYNNALKFMCDGKDNEDAPYDLYTEMLTGIEKYKMADITEENKSLSYSVEDDKALVSVYGASMQKPDTIAKLFMASDVKVDDDEVDYNDKLKQQHLMIGII